jgi:hypothetical protein
MTERDRVALRPEQATIPPGHSWNRLPVIGAACALLGAVACAILGAGNPKQFFFYHLRFLLRHKLNSNSFRLRDVDYGRVDRIYFPGDHKGEQKSLF